MTDKQIIIDETKCPWFNDGSCDLFYSDKEECWYRKCKDIPNCYYRETQTQLKRKEQECEELKKEAVNLKLNLKKVINLSQKKNRQCYQFLADIKQLKHQHQVDKGLITSTGKQNYQLLQEYDKLKNCLTEIKEIARVNSINTCWTAINLCVDCDEIKECGLQSPFEKLKAIIQKISEVEDV